MAIAMVLAFSVSAFAAKPKSFTLASPDEKTAVIVVVGDQITYYVTHNGQTVLQPSAVSMTIDGKEYGINAKLSKNTLSKEKGKFKSPIYKFSEVQFAYNELDLRFADGFGLKFRAYDNEGVAYRFYFTDLKGGEKVNAELAEFNFDFDYKTYVPYTTGKKNLYNTNFQNTYNVETLSAFNSESIAFTPLLVQLNNGVNVEITESDLEAYPGMFLKKNAGRTNSLVGDFAKVPSEVMVHQKRGEEKVVSYSDDMAIIREASTPKAPRFFPWRLIAIADGDGALLTNNLVALTAAPNRIGDFGWVKPGKIAWDWWNDWDLFGVDFRAGINTETYKYFIDFASANKIEYVVLDEGWSEPLDMLKIKPEVDLKAILDYAKSKNVGIVLWCVAHMLDSNLETICKTYADMGVKGFKVDFINRDDQLAVETIYRIDEMCAKYKLMLDFHGMYKPAGMNHTYPHVVNFEGVWGLEELKWEKDGGTRMVEYDVTFPFIRTLAGPCDYTQGAMRNATKKEFRANYSHPMSGGTRCRQVAEYVIFDSPFEMMCDSPSMYMKEQETTSFIAQIPTVWDETVVLDAKIGEYILLARRNGKTWYVGGLTNWDARDITVNFDFLKGSKNATVFRDGVNADRNATDYKLEKVKVAADTPMTVHMAPGGGFAMIIK